MVVGPSSIETPFSSSAILFSRLCILFLQHLDTDHGAPGDNLVKPDVLNELDRRILKEAFRQARKIQLRLKLDYQV